MLLVHKLWFIFLIGGQDLLLLLLLSLLLILLIYLTLTDVNVLQSQMFT